MNEKKLVWICIIGSVIGIVSLYFISFMIEPLDIGAGEITFEYAGRKVKISGTVQNLHVHRNGHIFFELRDDTGKSDIVIWRDRVKQLSFRGVNMSKLHDGAAIELTGDVEYNRGVLTVVV